MSSASRHGTQTARLCPVRAGPEDTAECAPNGGSARGYQGTLVPLAALSSPGYGPIDSQKAVYFSLSHKRREDRLDPNIWDSSTPMTLDLRALEP
jgi:hypothetical protein